MAMHRTTTGLVVSLALLLLWAAPAAAQETLMGGENRPWARGVSLQNQSTAEKLFQEGNAFLRDSVFVKAVEKYRQALKHWNHPGIHYNLALALLNLDQPVEVHEHMTAAMRYGEPPLDKEKFEHAQSYTKFIEKQLARVELTSNERGAIVTMDGQKLFVGPGRYEGLVRPGPHTFIATMDGYVPTDLSRALSPGETVKLDFKMYTADELTRYRRKWAAWKPWTVLGVGVALAAGGGLIHMQSRNSYRDFDVQALSCPNPCYLKENPDLANKLSRGDSLQKLATGAYAVGGAALVTGAVLVYVNRLRPYRLAPGEREQEVVVAPVLDGDTSGVLATFRF